MKIYYMLFLIALLLGCKENQPSNMQFDLGIPDQTAKKDQLTGDVTHAPDALTCQTFGPVKVLLMVDSSGSIATTDPKNTRQAQII